MYFISSGRSLNWIELIEDFLQLFFIYLPEAGHSYGPFHSRLPPLIIQNTDVCRLASFLLLLRGIFRQGCETEDELDVACLPPPCLLLYLRLGWA